MNEMIERGASVLRRTEEAWLLREDDAQNGLVEANSEPLYHAMARALIEAMRVPTDSQCREFFRIKKEQGWSDAQACFSDAEWERMIDAALGGEE